MRLFTLLLAAIPVVAQANLKEAHLVSVTSNKAEGTLQVRMVLDEENHIKAFKYYTAGNPNQGQVLGTPVQLDHGFFIPNLPRADLVRLSTTKNTGPFSAANGGRITIKFITNVVFGSADYMFYDLEFRGDRWVFSINDSQGRRPISRMYIVGTLAGISEIRNF